MCPQPLPWVAEQAKQAEDLAKQVEDNLATLNIQFWGHGEAFYWIASDDKTHAVHAADFAGDKPHGVQWANVMGVLLTALLLTFGAPFWYETLRNLNVLNDALRPRKAKEKPTM